MLVGTDVCVRMVFVWEETGVPGGNPPVWLGDHMTISHAAVRGECVNTAPARQLCKTPNWKDCKQILANISTVPVYLVNFCLLYILKQTEVSCWYPPYSYRPLHRQSVVVYGLQVVPVTPQILYPYSTPPSIECNKAYKEVLLNMECHLHADQGEKSDSNTLTTKIRRSC